MCTFLKQNGWDFTSKTILKNNNKINLKQLKIFLLTKTSSIVTDLATKL